MNKQVTPATWRHRASARGRSARDSSYLHKDPHEVSISRDLSRGRRGRAKFAARAGRTCRPVLSPAFAAAFSEKETRTNGACTIDRHYRHRRRRDNNRRQFLSDIRAMYWDESPIDLFAFTLAISRMQWARDEREKKTPSQAEAAVVAASLPRSFLAYYSRSGLDTCIMCKRCFFFLFKF
ncbi:hypothetical protein PUN28_016781 [Cardiocondyla obscurior]|uniref:Uncharacterized protein n=1 Tax=Cardiocondyla obscurior TaxID=286306 RepID=A0AAW2ESI5_9HYME